MAHSVSPETLRDGEGGEESEEKHSEQSARHTGSPGAEQHQPDDSAEDEEKNHPAGSGGAAERRGITQGMLLGKADREKREEQKREAGPAGGDEPGFRQLPVEPGACGEDGEQGEHGRANGCGRRRRRGARRRVSAPLVCYHCERHACE